MAKETKTIKQIENFPADPVEVYEALVDPKKHTEFTGSKATGAPRVGAKFTAWDGYISGKHLELEKGKRIVQEWRTTEWPEDYEPSTLKFTLKKAKNGTELTMIHSNVPAEQAESYRQGWIDSYWDPLREYFKKKR
jgi:activator of HSP90 ATPase